MLPTQNHGIIKASPGVAEFAKISIPRLRDDYILVKTIAVALNPADWQNLDEKVSEGRERKIVLSGHDAAGIVAEVGKNVKRNLKVGDRVAGFSFGGEFSLCLLFII
jgi:NADPH:quinone reductase-like Zn-dependent oxidoreductase